MNICVEKAKVPVYPDDYHSSKNDMSVSISSREVNKLIEDALAEVIFRDEKDDYDYIATGDTIVLVFKSEEGYKFIVSDDYKEADVFFN